MPGYWNKLKLAFAFSARGGARVQLLCCFLDFFLELSIEVVQKTEGTHHSHHVQRYKTAASSHTAAEGGGGGCFYL